MTEAVDQQEAALEVVSLERVKTDLRIETAGHDDLLKGQIAEAVSFVSRMIGMPLVETVETIYAERPVDPVAVLTFPARVVQEVTKVQFWTPAGALREEPDGLIDGADLGRRVSIDRWTAVHPPAAGWPDVLSGSLLAVEVKRQLILDAKTDALKRAVILGVRQSYDGHHEIKPTAAVYALIAPFRRYD